MKLKVNGEQHEHQGGGSIPALLAEIGADGSRTALMVNGTVVPSETWTESTLKENDEIEVLVFVGGG